MQAVPNEEAWESKFSALPFFNSKEQLVQGRELYKRYLKDYPTAVNRWCEYIDLEMKYGNNREVENIFRLCLLQLPDVDIVERYINYILKNFDDEDPTLTIGDLEKGQFKKIQESAFLLAIQLVGLDINAMPIYRKFINFLSQTEYGRVLNRQLYFNINRIPMTDRADALAKYDEFLTDEQVKKDEKMISEATKTSHVRLTSYLSKMDKLRKKHAVEYGTNVVSLGTKEVLSSYVDVLDYETTLDGQPRAEERSYTSNGKELKYEVCPKSLEMKAQQERIFYMMNKMLMVFYRYPQAWIVCAQYFQRRGNIDLAINILRRGRNAVDCPLLKLYESFCYLISGREREGLDLLSNESDLEQIYKLKMAGRCLGMKTFRKVLLGMKGELKPYAYIAAAEVEFCFFRRKTAALNIFKEALKKYSKDNKVIKAYYKFLVGITPSRFVSNALVSYNDVEVDKFMSEIVTDTFKGMEMPKDTKEILEAEKKMEECGEKRDERLILGNKEANNVEWKRIHTEVNKDIIKEFIYILPPAELYKGVRIDAEKLINVLGSIIN
ncbi:Cleavage stimulation factor 77 kDa subunit, putative [Entamoeba invadens IP1]|uniref:Cleavage stimulation factor 77 kDa subunit, putative n=1 Tax=Entamoeba invadens TaxID=33085 RepID=S0B6U2_ENTIV|nr:Cleavage stimulation factor 77 kDa subunit, putative [Entamoeba invadens IP1]ELP93777.1 Cleavage stimulation factor 77 kDa subunit, putative [Entamoeba invadens IP1]BAN42421.1 cleavage stimulation factor 77 kDa subunit, putative [Entamoeba invadens]|eukprot:XP_004260548.1 Cleavage stimulation factor 77 kDa subunit, putative [Entamoeba invadens IP1]